MVQIILDLYSVRLILVVFDIEYVTQNANVERETIICDVIWNIHFRGSRFTILSVEYNIKLNVLNGQGIDWASLKWF